MALFSSTYKLYTSHKIATGVRPKSLYHIDKTWLPILGDMELDDITSDFITAQVDRLTKQRKWSQTTRTTCVNVLSGYFKWAMMRGMVAANPCSLVPRKTGKKLANERRFVISKPQLKKLLKVLRLEPPIHDICLFASRTGLRFSAITNLSPVDLHKDENGTSFVEVINKNDDEHRVYLFGEVAFPRVCGQLIKQPSHGVAQTRPG